MNYESARCFAGHARQCRQDGFHKEARRSNHLLALMIDNSVRPERSDCSLRLHKMTRLLRTLQGLRR